MSLVDRASQALEQLIEVREGWKHSRTISGYRDNLGNAEPFDALGCDAIQKAEAFWWERPIVDLIELSAKSLPDWTMRRDLFPVPIGFNLLARSMDLPTNEVEPTGHGSLAAILWAVDSQGCLMVGFDRRTDGHLVPDEAQRWAFGSEVVSALELENGQTKTRHSAFARYLGACLLFLEQRLVIGTLTPPDRIARRRVGRADITYPPLRVITLRTPKTGGRYDDSTSVDWQYRWMVRGHWRQQWYGSDQSHRPVWILPHVKGPEDKPFKAPDKSMFAVVR